jgi:hypothetical protein
MTQKQRNENARVVCLFCGSPTFVPASTTRDIADGDCGPGIALVRCHVCRKEAPYSASEIFLAPEVTACDDDARSRAAGL